MVTFIRSKGRRFIGGAMLLMLALACCSCATGKQYVEPAGSTAHLAVLRAASPVWVNSIDGLAITKGLKRGVREFRITPGEHAVAVGFGNISQQPVQGAGEDILLISRSRGKAIIRFKARAGETYDIDYAIYGRRVNFFIPQLVTFENYEPNTPSSRD